MRVVFPGNGLQLEGALSGPATAAWGAVVCHPHPQYGGDMDNPVVLAVAEALASSGAATVRFNFRGVGASTGVYDRGIGEADDARAAIAYLCERAAVQRVTLAGYSFGAMVTVRVGAAHPVVDRLLVVGPPLSFFDLAQLAACDKRKLFVLGDRDQYCSVARLTRQLQSVAAPKTRCVISGADHFFSGHEAAVAGTVRTFVSGG